MTNLEIRAEGVESDGQIGAAIARTGVLADTMVVVGEDTLEWNYVLDSKVYEAMMHSDAAQLSTMLNATVEMTMPQGTSGVYSRKQAEVILDEFLSTTSNPVYTIEHERPNGNATLTILNLQTDKANYRIFILTQSAGTIIRQIRIEAVDE